jgi:hypothetical protein
MVIGDNAKEKSVKLKFIFAGVLSALFIFLVWYKSGIYFETNDDRYISSMLSGVITGYPEANVPYVNYLLTLPLSLLYRINYSLGWQVQWYGIVLILFHWLAYTFIIKSAWVRCSGPVQMIITSGVAGVFCMSFYYMLGHIQFTSTAMLLAMTGWFCLIMYRDSGLKKGLLLFFVFELLGYLLRNQAMLIIQPMGAAVWVSLCLTDSGESIGSRIKICVKHSAAMLAVLAMAVLAGMCGSLLGGEYSGAIKEYREFDSLEVELFDYYGKPEYSQVRDILDRYGVSEAMYNAYLNYTVLKETIPLECERELAEYTKTIHVRSVKEAFDGFKSIYLQDYQWNLDRFAECAFVVLIICIFLSGKYNLILPCAGLLAAHVFTWGYLFYRGRVLMRVTVPLFACGALLPLALILTVVFDCNNFKVKNTEKKYIGIVKNIILTAACVILVMTGFSSGRQQYRFVRSENEGQNVFMEGINEIIQYCQEHEENRYILEAVSMSYYKGSALENRIYHPSNYVISGGWFSNMPNVRQRMNTYLDEREDIYLIIYSDGNEENHPSVKYLEEFTGREAKTADHLESSIGISYTVYRF